jgi:hypothetical protein
MSTRIDLPARTLPARAHSGKSGPSGKHSPTPLRKFSGIDGESYTVNGEHRYVLLMDSSGEYIFDGDGIGSKRCFDFLLGLPPKRIYVAFGLNYDVNMMLRDLGVRKLKELWVLGETSWFHYHLEWIPGKWFEIRDRSTGRKIKVNEVFGFFQTSFVKSLAKWKIEVQDQEELEAMKLSRSLFDPDMRERMIDYCRMECELLNSLMTQLRSALMDCGIKNTSWNGAGSIAAAILKKERVGEHLVLPEAEGLQDAILRAYFGGRTELFKQGTFSEIHQFDIVSAYPYAATFMPSLRGTWAHTKHYEPDSTFSIWEVSWVAAPPISPFPYRRKQSIQYPLTGRGFYHACEVRAAIDSGASIQVHGGWVFTPDDSTVRPFDFVKEYAARKVAYKRAGHAGEKVLKLGINSLYGKLAQGLGYGERLPPYQCYYWAGYITAMCRATMGALANEYRSQVVMVATDGIFFDGPLPGIPTGDSLGNLEYTRLKNVFVAQPGVYHAWADGQEIRKSRGMFAKEVDFDDLREGYKDTGPWYVGSYQSTRFQGLGVSLQRRTLEGWRSWPTTERNLSLYPNRKTLGASECEGVYLHTPPVSSGSDLSEPYTPKSRGYLEDEEDYKMSKDQPLREL